MRKCKKGRKMMRKMPGSGESEIKKQKMMKRSTQRTEEREKQEKFLTE